MTVKNTIQNRELLSRFTRGNDSFCGDVRAEILGSSFARFLNEGQGVKGDFDKPVLKGSRGTELAWEI